MPNDTALHGQLGWTKAKNGQDVFEHYGQYILAWDHQHHQLNPPSISGNLEMKFADGSIKEVQIATNYFPAGVMGTIRSQDGHLEVVVPGNGSAYDLYLGITVGYGAPAGAALAIDENHEVYYYKITAIHPPDVGEEASKEIAKFENGFKITLRSLVEEGTLYHLDDNHQWQLIKTPHQTNILGTYALSVDKDAYAHGSNGHANNDAMKMLVEAASSAAITVSKLTDAMAATSAAPQNGHNNQWV